MNKNQLTFEEFITQRYPNYKIDEDNRNVIRLVSLWAARSPEFEKSGEYYLHKSLFLIGNVGTGKSDLFHMLQVYLSKYLNSRLKFRREVVWEFTARFCKKGYESLQGQDSGNCYYDELCLTEDGVGTGNNIKFPNKELASFYGNKLLVGGEIIMKRYDVFKNDGLHSHFSSNASLEELKEIYGERAFSRLTEMCNFLFLLGLDRRGGKPNIYFNVNEPPPPTAIPHTDPLVIQEELEQTKQEMQQIYETFKKTGVIDHAAPGLLFLSMQAHGLKIIEQEDLQKIIDEVSSTYTSPPGFGKQSASELKAEREMQIMVMARRTAIERFFKQQIESKTDKLFGAV